MFAFSKKYGYILGLVLEAPELKELNPERVRVLRFWLYGKEDKKLQNNIFYSNDIELKELDADTLLIEENKVKALWDNNMSKVMNLRDIWQKTWVIK